MLNLYSDSRSYRMLGYAAAGTTDEQSSVTLDLRDGDGCMFVASVGAVAAGGAARVVPQYSSSTATTSMTDLSTAAQGTTSGTTSDSNKLIVADVVRPTKRYMSVRFDRSTGGNVTLESLTAIVYSLKDVPSTQPSAHIIDSGLAVSPTT